jgi:hypothetical protein
MSKSFYYQIKGKSNIGNDIVDSYWGGQNWVFPSIFSGKVEAENKKEAKILIEEEYDKIFPLRVLKKDLESNEFLLSIEEIKEGSHIWKLFELKTCLNCGETFYMIDKYNDHNTSYKGHEFCSYDCKEEQNNIRRMLSYENNNISGNQYPIIYKITNKNNNLCYIGKTTQVFTLRWYQHFFQSGNCKFHNAIKESKFIDWTFEVIELVKIPENIKRLAEIENIIFERERHWINYYDSINNGYNSKN